MRGYISVNDTSLWPTLGETLEELSRKKVLTRETAGADVYMRTLDRAGGMERTGAAPVDQLLFGGIVAGKGMDWASYGNVTARDVTERVYDAQTAALTVNTASGSIINSFI